MPADAMDHHTRLYLAAREVIEEGDDLVHLVAFRKLRAALDAWERYYEEGRLVEGLETIRRVLDWATAGRAGEHARMVWLTNSVADLLDGRRIMEPPR